MSTKYPDSSTSAADLRTAIAGTSRPIDASNLGAAALEGPISRTVNLSDWLPPREPAMQAIEVNIPKLKEEQALGVLRSALEGVELKGVKPADLRKQMGPEAFPVVETVLGKAGIKFEDGKSVGDTLSAYALKLGGDEALSKFKQLPDSTKGLLSAFAGAAVAADIVSAGIKGGPDAILTTSAKWADRLGLKADIPLIQTSSQTSNGKSNFRLGAVVAPVADDPVYPLNTALKVDYSNINASNELKIGAQAGVKGVLPYGTLDIGYTQKFNNSEILKVTMAAAVDPSSQSLNATAAYTQQYNRTDKGAYSLSLDVSNTLGLKMGAGYDFTTNSNRPDWGVGLSVADNFSGNKSIMGEVKVKVRF